MNWGLSTEGKEYTFEEEMRDGVLGLGESVRKETARVQEKYGVMIGITSDDESSEESEDKALRVRCGVVPYAHLISDLMA
ncbi:unnamed protein product [Dovyalis caffra]|uniref:Uncharacterized protein n=1 Tax=Dovyalis caffra TaxID=77055 RepID=A0AAV1R3B0_9ROSI|nr:unnamed protein product [Dovyalis caffra]